MFSFDPTLEIKLICVGNNFWSGFTVKLPTLWKIDTEVKRQQRLQISGSPNISTSLVSVRDLNLDYLERLNRNTVRELDISIYSGQK